VTTDPHSVLEELTEAPVDAQGHDRLLYTTQFAIHKEMLAKTDITLDDDFLPHSLVVRAQAESRADLRQALLVMECVFSKMIRDLDKLDD